jgi:hypothetical protein
LNSLDTISFSRATLTDGYRSLFTPHTTATVFPKQLNRLRFVINTRYVFCEAETGFLHIAYNTLRIHGAVTWVRPRFDPSSVRVRFVVGEVALGQVFLRALRFPVPVSFHQCSIHTFIYCCSYQDKRAHSGNLQNNAVIGSRVALDTEVL